MPEYLVNFRSNTGNLFNVHICNIEDEQYAVQVASNSLLTDEECTYESLFKLNPQDSFITPF